MDLVATLKLNADEYLRGIDEAAAGWDEFSGKITAANKDWSTFASDLMSGGAALTAGVTLPIAALGGAALKMAADFEQAEIGFTTMLGSGKEAQQFLQELKSFAASTPFDFPELQTSAKRLMALGFEANAVIPIMRTVGDAAALLAKNAADGGPLIDRITLALGQMSSKGKVSAQEMNQLAEAGIGAWQAVANAIGKSVPEAMKLAEKGMISAAEAIPAILEGMDEKFKGGMGKIAQTVTGQMSNLREQFAYILADLGKAIMPLAQTVLEFAKPMVEGVRSLVDMFANLPTPVQSAIVAFTGLVAAAGPLLLAFGGIISALTTLAPILGTAGIGSTVAALGTAFGGVALAVAAVVAAFELWKLESVQNAVKSLWDTVTGFWNETLKPFVDAVVAGGEAFATFAAGIIGSGLQSAWEAISGAAATLWDWLKQLWGALGELGGAFMSVLDSLSPLLSPLVDLAEWLGKIYVILLSGGLIAAWTALKAVLGFVGEILLDVAKILGGVLLTGLKGMASLVEMIGDALSKTLKPALQFTIDKISDFIDWLKKIPGVKQALDAVNTSFDKIKTSVVGATTETKKLNTETDKAKQATDGATDSAKKYSGGIDEVRRSLEAKTKATGLSAEETKKLEAEHKKTEKAVRDTGTALQGIITHLDRSKGSVNDLILAQQKIQDLQTKLTQQYGTDMPSAIKGMYLQLEIAKDRLADLQKEAEKLDLESAMKKADAAVLAYQTNLTNYVRNHSSTLATLTASSLSALDAANAEWTRQEEAFKRVTGSSRTELQNRATQAEQDYVRISQAGERSVEAVYQAEKKMLEARIALYEATGKAVSQSDRERLAELEGNLDKHVEKSKTLWDGLAKQVSTIFTDLSKSLTDRFFNIISGEGGWEGMKKNALGILEDIGKAVTRFGLEVIEGYMSEQLKKIAKELLPDLKEVFTSIFSQNGGVWKAVTGLFDHLGDLFKKTKDSIIGIGQEGLEQLSGWGIGGAGSAAGSAGGAASGGSGAAGGAGTAAGSGLAGLVGAIGSVATAVSSIVGNFQMHGMGVDLGRIEENTRYVKIDTQTAINLYNKYLPKLEGMETFNYNVIAPAWYDLLSHLDNYMPRFATAWETDIPADIETVHTSIENTKGTIESMRDALVDKLSGLVSGFGEKLAGVSASFKSSIDSSTSNLQSTLREIINSDTISRNSMTSAFAMLGGDIRNVQSAIYQTNMAPAMLTELGMIRGELINIKNISQVQINSKPSQVVVNVQAPPTANATNFAYTIGAAMKSQGIV